MAMTAVGLKARIITKLNAAGFQTTNPNCKIDAMAQAIAEAVIDEIQTNAVVATVTTCGSGAGTGTGTVS